MILAIDSTSEHLHLALLGPSWVKARRVAVGKGSSHSALILPTVDGLLGEAGAVPGELRGVVACVGPGGFTSLRIGVATAEGVALTGLPTWGFSAFELRAEALRQSGVSGELWVLLDGQRQEAFAQKWGEDSLSEACRHPISGLAGLLGGAPWWAPEGFRPRLEAQLGPCPIRVGDEEGATLQGLASLSRRKAALAPESPLVPFYLRETDAEVNFPDASIHLSPALRQGIPR